jgi:hypothetical protein
MVDPALGQKLKILTLCALGLVLAIFLGAQIGNSRYTPLLLGAVVVAVFSFSIFSGRFFWVLTIASSFLEGTFPILGGSFTPFQILMAIGVTKFLIGEIVLKHTKIKKPDRFDMLLIAGFMAVLVWHGIQDRFGMKFLGSSVWGGRNYVNVFVGLAAFFVILTIPVKPKVWAKLPYLILAVTTFDLFIAVITKTFPSTIYKIYPFYSAVSNASLVEIVTGDVDVTERVGAFGNFGFALITLVLASVALPRILHPSNFFRLVALIIGVCSAFYSGFRTAVINGFVGILIAGIRDLRWAVLAVLPFAALLLFGVSVINSEFVSLPKQVQRSLVFIPGHWDADMVQDARSSNDFRGRIWTLFLRSYFPVHPFLGRGFGFNSEWGEKSVYKNDPRASLQTVETGNIHNGFLATLDCLGIVGTIFFVIWNLRLLGRTLQVKFRRNDPEGIVLRFVAIYLGVWIICYWMGAATVGTFLPREFALAAVFLRLRHDDIEEDQQTSSVPEAVRPARHPRLAVT